MIAYYRFEDAASFPSLFEHAVEFIQFEKPLSPKEWEHILLDRGILLRIDSHKSWGLLAPPLMVIRFAPLSQKNKEGAQHWIQVEPKSPQPEFAALLLDNWLNICGYRRCGKSILDGLYDLGVRSFNIDDKSKAHVVDILHHFEEGMKESQFELRSASTWLSKSYLLKTYSCDPLMHAVLAVCVGANGAAGQGWRLSRIPITSFRPRGLVPAFDRILRLTCSDSPISLCDEQIDDLFCSTIEDVMEKPPQPKYVKLRASLIAPDHIPGFGAE